MGTDETHHSAKSLMMVVALATALSSFTLWLIESWIKYPLFLFEVLTIIVLYLIVSRYDVKITLKQTRVGNLNIGLTIDLFLIASALSLLMFNVLQIEGGLVQLSLALLCTSFLSGYALLNILGMSGFFSRLESLVISYLVSFAFSGFLFLFLLPFNQLIRPVMVCTVFLLLGIFSMVKHLKQSGTTLRMSLSKPIDVLPLAMTVIFYMIAFFLMYPGFTLQSGADISRLYASSIVLARNPNLYISFQYFLYKLFEACLHSMSTPSLAAFQSSLQLLNWISPFVFYVMAKEHLESIDKRLPSMATVFWVLFSNLGWLYFVKLKLTSSNMQSQLQLLSMTADKTYNGTIYASFGLWYTPLMVSFVMLLTLVYLLKRRDIPTVKYVALFSVITAAMYLTHVTEATIFALFLAAYGIFWKGAGLRVNDSLKASLLGFLMVGAVYLVLPMVTVRFTLNISLLLSIMLPIMSLSLALCLRKFVIHHIPRLNIREHFKISSAKVAIIVLLFLYAAALLTWASSTDSFRTWQQFGFGVVPFFFYPLKLGITCFLAILALIYVVRDRTLSKLVFFIGLILFIFIAGRTISFINVNFFDTGYWETRFLMFIGIATSILAPIAIVKVASNKGRLSGHAFKTFGICILVGVITLYGISSPLLALEYWHTVSNEGLPSNEEFDALNHLKTIFDEDPRSWLVTITNRSSSMATFSAPADKLNVQRFCYSGRPELLLNVLYRMEQLSHPYLYMHNRDVEYMEKYCGGSYFANHLINELPTVFRNEEVVIYNVSQVSPPLPSSNTTLIFPFNTIALESERYLFAYDILSQSLSEYTVAYDLDDKALQSETLILPFDPPAGNIIERGLYDDFSHELSWLKVSGAWNVVDGELLGGESGKKGEGIILSPIKVQNFTSSFKVKPISGDPKQLSYAQLIYSWRDSKNFRYASLLFSPNGYIYVMFVSVDNGVVEEYPSWSGINTGIKWVFGDSYDVAVTVNGSINEVFINGEKYLTEIFENVGGYVGLRYYGFYGLEFDDFDLRGTVYANLRIYEDYLEYMESGGKLVVLNTNGFGAFSNRLFSAINAEFKAEAIECTDRMLELPAKVDVPILDLKTGNASVVSYYTSSSLDTVSAYAIKENIGTGQLTYVNIYPIIRLLTTNFDKKPLFYNIQKRLLEVGGINLATFQPTHLPNTEANFREVILKGEINVETPSVLFPSGSIIEKVSVNASDKILNFNNVSSLSFINYRNLQITTDSMNISEGGGFYATLTISGSAELRPSGDGIVLTLKSGGQEFKISNSTSVLLYTVKPFKVYARTPYVNVSGNAFFKELRTTGLLNLRTQTYGQDLNVTGCASFGIFLFDGYAYVDSFNIDGHFERYPPLIIYSEWSALPSATFWVLILLPVYLGVVLIAYSHKPKRYKVLGR